MKTFLISPPFGNWIGHRRCTSVRGSYTWERRPGLIYHTIRTLRKTPGGWVNRIGLRNPGIRACETYYADQIYSLVGLKDGDWERMLSWCPAGLAIEVNLGCPNVHEYGIPFKVLCDYCDKFVVGAKLTPNDQVDEMAAMCIEAGVRYLHLSNTAPTERGGESGRQLLRINLPIVERLAPRYPGKIIAGGGIYDPVTVKLYRAFGASGFSLATVWLTPWRVPAILHA
jgi:dihydroorotate dehydrogenase